MKIKAIIIIMVCFLGFNACEKEAGPGGRATIQGKLFIQEVDSDGDIEAEYYAADTDVFIVYGDDPFYGESVKTHYDGTYLFDFLQKGEYEVYAYSKCRTCPSGIEAISQNITISEADEYIILEDLVVKD